MATIVKIDSVIVSVRKIMENTISQWFPKYDLSYITSILFIISSLEKWIQETNFSFTTLDIIQAAIRLVPTLIDIMINLGIITKEGADQIKQEIEKNKHIIESLRTLYVFMSNHPEIIKAGQKVISGWNKIKEKFSKLRCCRKQEKLSHQNFHEKVEAVILFEEFSDENIVIKSDIETISEEKSEEKSEERSEERLEERSEEKSIEERISEENVEEKIEENKNSSQRKIHKKIKIRRAK